jgi:hypothetical protein
MPDPTLDICKHLSSIGLIPAPIQLFGRNTKLDNEVARQVLRFGLAALFPPKPEESRLILAHNDPGVRAADEIPPIRGLDPDPAWVGRGLLRRRVWVRYLI